MAHTRRTVAGILLSMLVTGLVVFASTTDAEAATLYVANDGLDGPSCGGKASPCRSLSRGIANANAGDTLLVGPGRYGDLDGDADFNDAGEETGPSQACQCIVFVTKPLTIVSQSGATTTIIDGGGLSGAIVRIAGTASGTVFGKKRKGFTLRGGGGGGLLTDGAVNGAKITSNVVTGNNGAGFIVFGSNGVQLTGNVSAGNGFGAAGVVGFSISGSGHVLRGNVATANDGDGFTLFFGSATFVGNVATANRFRGFTVSGDYVFQGNSALGNRFGGIAVSTDGAVTKNNVFGNNTVDDIGLTNCGIRAFSGATIDASKNYWGAATGPGADSADAACVSGAGSSIMTAPFATKAFKVKALP